MTDTHIRDFALADADAVLRLWVVAGLKPSRSDTYEAMARVATGNPRLVLVAVDPAGRVVGTARGATTAAGAGFTGWPWRPTGARSGSAAGSSGWSRTAFGPRGCEKLNIPVERDNPAAIAFRRQMDYVEDDVMFLGKWLTS